MKKTTESPPVQPAAVKAHPLRALRTAGVPLAAFETSDPALTIMAGLRALNGKAESVPVLQWDCSEGLTAAPTSRPGANVAQEIAPNAKEFSSLTYCLQMLREKMPDSAIVWLHNAHRFLDDPATVQALWNLRDAIKTRHGLVIMLAPSIQLPSELKNDVIVVSEPLPDEGELKRIVSEIHESAQQAEPQDGEKIIDALLGLSAFGAEQSLALAMRKNGLDRADLWERKRKMIEQTPGLAVWRGGETFDDIGGCDNVKSFMGGVMSGKRAPRAVVFIDEIEKALGGAAGDMSGVSQDYLGTLLSFMQDKQAAGCIFIGPPGAAKSMVAKAAGNTTGVPTIQFDLGGMKGSLVGESERRIREALKVADAVGQGRLLFIATCNSFGNLPPELKRRFTLGTFFFDLPSKEERAKIWAIYKDKFRISPEDLAQSVFNEDGWTGAEIRQCCDIADRIGATLAEASKFIVPVAKSAAETIETLRKQASGKFISASQPGLYQFQVNAAPAPTSGRRFGDS